MRPPFAYFGGKQKIAATIAAMLPEHTHYVEPYAGGLSVLLAKKPSRLETVNDLDGDIVHFWRMLRDRPTELARACALTPHSRAERKEAMNRPHDMDDLERARRIWVCLAEGRTGTLRPTGWRFDSADFAHTSMPRRLDGYVRRMEAVATRLRPVSLECRPGLDVITAYGKGRRTLMYVDPPYIGDVRERNYRNEMLSADEHRALADALHACAATVVLSGYASTLYDDDLYADWYRVQLSTATSQGGVYKGRTEVLWSNRPLRLPAHSDVDIFSQEDDGCNEMAPVEGACNETRCPACAGVVRQASSGRRRVYCSSACRVRAHRQASLAG
ncbi:D12 class N6 adenine-specific DNA methyltransferase (plasmid) [Mycobacteroides abscessus subsp. bolletii 50594]|uniref:D12 class N6 adenine-specific DNA methyltransferase n=1 Tax=Mycobacteroides abscessus subsp. bolletii 50594 TaxID=1303024 RepID=A0AB33AIN5_9MYCO|nr:D12 class N6 adenine-specific DNA methyltransferase [Mycobacteroides abscessus subsp. bolletii 50594]